MSNFSRRTFFQGAALAVSASRVVGANDKINVAITGTQSGIVVTPGPAHHIAFGQQPTDTVTGNVISPDVTVRVLDKFNNLVTTSTLAVAMEILNNNYAVSNLIRTGKLEQRFRGRHRGGVELHRELLTHASAISGRGGARGNEYPCRPP